MELHVEFEHITVQSLNSQHLKPIGVANKTTTTQPLQRYHRLLQCFTVDIFIRQSANPSQHTEEAFVSECVCIIASG